jgi:hypothetical protein
VIKRALKVTDVRYPKKRPGVKPSEREHPFFPALKLEKHNGRSSREAMLSMGIRNSSSFLQKPFTVSQHLNQVSKKIVKSYRSNHDVRVAC